MVKFIGSQEPFVDLGDNIIVALGMEEHKPHTPLQKKLQNEITREINEAAGLNITRPSVALTVKDDVTQRDKHTFGMETNHIQQYDFDLGEREITGGLVDGVHNHLVDRLRASGYTITGTETTIS